MSDFEFTPAAVPGRWFWRHRSTGIKGETSERVKAIVENLARVAAERRTQERDEMRAAHTAELEAAQARLEAAHDEAFLMGFAAGTQAEPQAVVFRLP